MTAPKSNDEDDPADPETPSQTSPTKTSTSDAAPGKTSTGKDATLSKDGTPTATPGAGRPRSATTRLPPTLLGDFLLGRPSPARVAASRKAAREAARERRKSLEMVKQEMRQAAVMRIQAPGGVHDRVKKWQKTNAAAMANADPLATPTEPSEVNIQVDEESVTEEDRVRIKSRQKKKSPLKGADTQPSTDGGGAGKENKIDPKLTTAPKKRVVSDTNWMKEKKKNAPPANHPPKAKPNEGAGNPLPKDFLARTAANPSVAKKVRDWASKVEIPDQHPKRHRPATRSVGSSDGLRMKSAPSESDVASARSASARLTTVLSSSLDSKETSNDGIRVRPIQGKDDVKSEGPTSPGLVVEPLKLRKSNTYEDDGIRVIPTRSENSTASGRSHSIRVAEASGARKPRGGKGSNAKAESAQKQTYREESVLTESQTASSLTDLTTESSDLSSRRTSKLLNTSGTGTRSDRSPSDRTETAGEETGSDRTQTPPHHSSRQPSKQPHNHTPKATGEPSARSQANTGTTATEEVSGSDSWSSDSVSEMPFSVLPKSLADIPVGYSAFSELDLQTGSRRPSTRPKSKRQTSFKGATNALKKALTEGKKILTEKVDHPKPVPNQPPNIETWLKDTVDPFINSPDTPETSENKRSVGGERVDESKTQRSTPPRHRHVDPSSPLSADKREDNVRSKEISKTDPDQLHRTKSTTPTSPGLKRSRATRLSSSASKNSIREGLKEKLKDAFRGESAGHGPPRFEYPSCPEVVDLDDERESEYRERRRSSGTRNSQSLEDQDHDDDDNCSSHSSDTEKLTPSPLHPKRKPPTNGFHELSTIVSELESYGTIESDLSSVLSHTTITEAPTLSRSRAVSRRGSQKPSLKRRHTKHSDLVSVLSLPKDDSMPRKRSSRRSQNARGSPDRPGDAAVDGLLNEFSYDEDLYQRELKTLVDGVIPVLLTQFVHNTSRARRDLFGSPPNRYKEDTLDNAVVNMGIALETLRNNHIWCPLSDLHKLPQWLEGVHSIYNHYLDVWRLGFQGIIVNLAPRAPGEEDSLINAMPRNEQGDIVDEDGERIDVAHLLKRPLVRVKRINKFIQGYRSATNAMEFEPLASKWATLQEKARRRHKEEVARVVDDDAKNTDTSRTHDLRTLEALENVRIDRLRQVYAKDTFSLDLRHSNGQRLECHVELVSRDNILFKSDPGDLLIRETGSGGRSWLLFAPVLGGRYSARRGDDKNELVVMIRGPKEEWFELLLLKTDNEDQVLDWLNILGSDPIPPAFPETLPPTSRSSVPPSTSEADGIPMGEKRYPNTTNRHTFAGSVDKPDREIGRTQSRERVSSLPNAPNSPHHAESSTQSDDKTLPQDSYPKSRRQSRVPTVNEPSPRSFSIPEPLSIKKTAPNSTPYRDDGAPPPPVHRTFSSKKAPLLAPPVDQHQSRLKRRTSSPLKHEYHPSDVSSEDSMSSSGSGDEDLVSEESSDDELEAADIPDTTPAISIKHNTEQHPSRPFVSESAVSLTPSASASQAGLPRFESEQPAYSIKSIASISYWDNKHGRWKDLWPELCSIVTTPGLIEAFPLARAQPSPKGTSQEEELPLVALDLTPLVMLRNSTAVDLEIKSPVLSYAKLYEKVAKYESSVFRFRTQSIPECGSLYTAVHRARMDNAKYKALEEEARVRSFGQYQRQEGEGEGEGEGSSNRRGWFGRKNSYRASTRAPSQSAGSISQSSSMSASSFLRKLIGNGNQSFNIGMSSVDRQSRSGAGEASLYTSSSSSATPPRSPSVSLANSGNTRVSLTTNNLKVRLHLMISPSRWEDYGNCLLEVTRPDDGARQSLRKWQGMEKRIVVTTIPKKSTVKPLVILDIVLGSRCFSRLGSRGVLLNVWEEVKNESGEAGVAPQGGASGGNVSKWCFQCSSPMEASWIFGLVTQEVVIS
ncbi:hypothetical protein GGS23DRAFT_559168 [Durotheca rogersii]|uniref:uncharacterized protein n=1 Tax=Durotheca rogersii TaxID=419775 RepID=UPI002220926B|nr:uncharacterized protein GGS23DRAFT_559168 [Durotheca rogersii]KAI5865418.1 hypothetical protein GGS23DRAFT_559168 [Durotheca rogersii]